MPSNHNRTAESSQSGACPTLPSLPTPTASYNANNQVTWTSVHAAVLGLGYDAAGNVVNDNLNTYLYDGEGRICAIASTPVPGFTTMTGYLYDADGTRVAKGTITAMSCDPAVNGFQTTSDYVLGPGGEQVAEMGVDANGTLAHQHTNVWAGGKLLATYDNDGLHFYLDDPLGTRRVQTDYAGAIEQQCTSLPYGNGESCSATPTEHLFTGKERDTESGNDYFGARYYASNMGTFLSPDWSVQAEPVPYAKLGDPQTLNLYAYVRNNPIGGVDPDGHDAYMQQRGLNPNGGWNIPQEFVDQYAPYATEKQESIWADQAQQPGPVSTTYVLTLWNDSGQDPKPALPLEGRQLEYDLEGAPNAANPNGTPTDTTNVTITEHLNPGMPNGTKETSQSGNTGQFLDVQGRNGDRTHTGTWTTDRYFTVTKGGKNLGVVPILDTSSSKPHVMDHIQINMSTGAVKLNGHLDPIDVH